MPRNVILYGSAGTGKTLLLIEIWRMKVAYYKMLAKKPIKVIIATYSPIYVKTDQLIQDLKTKYNLQDILEEFKVEPKTIDELSESNFILPCFLNYIIQLFNHQFQNLDLSVKVWMEHVTNSTIL